MADTKTTCLPQEHREATYTVAALHQWALDVPDEDTNCVRTAQDWIENVIHPQSPGGPFPCVSRTPELAQRKRSPFTDQLCISPSIHSSCKRPISRSYEGLTAQTSTSSQPSKIDLIRTTFSNIRSGHPLSQKRLGNNQGFQFPCGVAVRGNQHTRNKSDLNAPKMRRPNTGFKYAYRVRVGKNQVIAS